MLITYKLYFVLYFLLKKKATRVDFKRFFSIACLHKDGESLIFIFREITLWKHSGAISQLTLPRDSTEFN